MLTIIEDTVMDDRFYRMDPHDLRSEFVQLLERSGITKAELARRIGVKPGSVTNWKDNPPRYATAYLELLIECNRWRP